MRQSTTAVAPSSMSKRIMGTADARVVLMRQNFAKRGLTVISVGQDYLISMPVPALFMNQSPQLTMKSYGLLNEIARFLKEFRTVAITINVYSNKYSSPAVEHALTLARAKAITDYLWSQDVDSRLMFANGAGSRDQIADDLGCNDKSPNARVEIVFRNTVV